MCKEQEPYSKEKAPPGNYLEAPYKRELIDINSSRKKQYPSGH